MTKLKLDWSARLTLAGLLALGVNTAVAADEPAPCASAKIVSGDSCKDLKVKFDLSQCKGNASVDGQVKCASGVGTVMAEGPGGTYTADLKETWGGTWAVSGPVRLTAAAAPAAAGTASAPAGAAPAAGMATPSGAAVTFGGAARLRYDDNFAKTPTGAVHTNYTSLRIRPTLNIKVNPDVNVFIEPQYNKTFGAVGWPPSATGVNTATASVGEGSYTGSADTLTVNQAFLEMKMDYGLSLQAGRIALRYGDQLILGSADWTDNGRSFDALKLRYTQDKSFIDVIASKVIENNKVDNTPTTDAFPTDDDKDMNGVYVSWNVNDTLKALEAYYLYIYDARQASAAPVLTGTVAHPAYFAVQGLRFVTAFDNIGWKGEWAQNVGSEGTEFVSTGQKDKNDMIDTEVSYNLNDSMKSRIGLQYYRAGQNWRDFYPTAAKQLGIVDVVGRRNLSGFALRYTSTFSDRYAMDADWFMFKRTSTDATAFAINSLTGIGSTATSSSDDVGQEIDLVGRFMPSKSLTWSLGFNVFMPGTYIKENQGTASGRVSHYGYVAADVKF